jgi:hypothetical protein
MGLLIFYDEVKILKTQYSWERDDNFLATKTFKKY